MADMREHAMNRVFEQLDDLYVKTWARDEVKKLAQMRAPAALLLAFMCDSWILTDRNHAVWQHAVLTLALFIPSLVTVMGAEVLIFMSITKEHGWWQRRRQTAIGTIIVEDTERWLRARFARPQAGVDAAVPEQRSKGTSKAQSGASSEVARGKL
jgi:hypothetical protein